MLTADDAPPPKKTLVELMKPTGDEDFVVLMAKIAFKNYQEGHLTKDALMYILKKCINTRALENGYVERHGLPFKGL